MSLTQEAKRDIVTKFGKTEAGAARIPRSRRVGTEEALERSVMRLARHPGPVILDRHHGFVRAVEVPADLRLAAAVSDDVLEHGVEDRFQRDAVGRDDQRDRRRAS